MADNARSFTASSSDECSITNPSGITTNAAWTMGAWIYANSLPVDGRGIIRVGNSTGAQARGVELGTRVGGGLTCSLAGSQSADGATPIVINTWTRVGATRAGSGVKHLTVVVNGSTDADVNTDPPTEITAGDVFRASYADSNNGETDWDGKLAWMFWLQGVVLTAAQIDSYLNNPQALITDYGPSGGVTANALKIFWTMQCNGGSTETDKSGAGQDGTYTGTTYSSGGGPTPTTDWNPCVAPGPTATASGQATVAITSNVVRHITTTAAGKGTTTVTAHRLLDVTVAPAGTSTAVATGKFLNNQHHITAAASGIGTVAVTPHAKRGLVVTSAGVAVSTVSANRQRNATLSISGQASIAATASKITGATQTASVIANSAVSVSATRLRNSTVLSTGISSTTSSAIRWRNVVLSVVNGSSTVSTASNRLRNSTTTANGSTSFSLTLRSALTAGVTGSSTVSSIASRIRAAQLGVIAGTSTAVASGIRWRNATLSPITGVAHTTVSVGAHRTVSTSIAGLAGVQVSIGARRRVTASVAGTTSLILQLVKSGSLFSSVSGKASLSLAVSAIRSILASSTGTSTSTVSVSRIRGATLTLTGMTSPSINLNAIYGHDTPAGQGLATVAAAIGKLNNQTHVASEADGTSTAVALCGTLVVPPSVIGKYSSQHLQAVSILGATRDLSGMHTRALAMLAEKGV